MKPLRKKIRRFYMRNSYCKLCIKDYWHNVEVNTIKVVNPDVLQLLFNCFESVLFLDGIEKVILKELGGG
jgi:hypothetical protein